MPKDYYKVLGIPRNANKDDIKKAYRALAHKFHPDKGGDETRFKEINEAYQMLSDDRKRAQYDQFGSAFDGAGRGGQGGFEWPGGFRFDFGPDGHSMGDFDFGEVFEDFLGFGANRQRHKSRRGKDIRLDLTINFEESVFGGRKEVDITKLARCARCQGTGGEPSSKQKSCPTCQGKGNIQKTQRTFLGSFTQVSTCPECFGTGKRPEVNCVECRGRGIIEARERLEIFIPRGIRDGEILKITGKGEASLSGGSPGDLYTKITVTSHAVFKRQGDDLVMHLPISISDAVLGGSKEIQTLEGSIKLKIPEGTQPGDVLKIRGKGTYDPSGYGRGDLLVEIKVDIPRKVNKQAKEVVEKLREEGL